MIKWHNPATCLKNQIPGSHTVKAEKVQKASNLLRCVNAILNACTSYVFPSSNTQIWYGTHLANLKQKENVSEA